ncbi:MAG: precorrin-6A/cobalt-precorrin-6A reductase [Clostridia bacterium]|nr:precorrin-6A/cobalt-precorrin-6A reductase [Clostridia bacterium]
MILVLAGTADAREIIRALKKAGYRVAASTISAYGARLAGEAGADKIHEGPLGGEGLGLLLRELDIQAVVDATHPFAREITRIAAQVCQEKGLPYFRYQRPAVQLPGHPDLLLAADFKAAARLASRGQVIFLTIGTRHLEVFTASPHLAGRRLVARVLPEEASLARCRQLGFLPRDIVALQGPCSYELNQALYRQFQAEVVVTKDSGSTGGVTAKVQAALDLGLTVVVIRRPPEPDSLPLGRILELLREDDNGYGYYFTGPRQPHTGGQ